MLPNLCSFVGIDEKINIDKLLDIDHLAFGNKLGGKPKICFVEWGVLYSPERSGNQNRYPTFDFICDFLSNDDITDKSLHLCGAAVDEFFEGRNEKLIKLLEENSFRIQLNFNIKKYDENYLIDKICEKSLDYEHALIIQHNKSKEKFINSLIREFKERNSIRAERNPEKFLIECNNYPFDILYDASGGFGKEIQEIKRPIHGCYTGYAGGLNPDNIKILVSKMNNIINDDYYIDMESGIRTDDWLDLGKCEKIITTLGEMKDNEIFN